MNLQPTIKNRKIKSKEEQWTACYCRLSCDDDLDGDSNSIRNQKMLLQKYADENHLRNVRFYVDDGFSGSNFERPDFKRMMSDVEDGKISTVIVKDMSRFGRDHILVGYYTKYYLAEADVRFIAIYDQVDSEKNPDDDITPFKNILNEMYAKDCSKKIKAVFKAKGNSGKHLASVPPLGYKKDPENKEKWIIDEKGAETVREIFKLCVQGFGPTQIADRLTAEGIPTPAEHFNALGYHFPSQPAVPGRWVQTAVADMLERQEYTGDTVNFRSTTKSFKNKKKIDRPKEDWKVFPDTHPAIIDRATFEQVQELRKNKRRPTREGKQSLFSGMVFCADCGEKLYFCTAKNFRPEQNWFTCSSARKTKGKCTAHFIRDIYIQKAVLESMRRVFWYVRTFENRFAEELQNRSLEEQKKEQARKKRELEKAEKRIAELDLLFRRLYEDNVAGKISDERFQMLSAGYETEQSEKKTAVEAMKAELAASEEQTEGIGKFIRMVKSVTEPTVLTPELVHRFVSKIVVHEARKIDGVRHQDIDIYYSGVGIIYPSDPEEMERLFQEHLKTGRNRTRVYAGDTANTNIRVYG